LAVAVEDAGFEIRDSIAWLYGSGFPKSLDVSKAIDKAAGAEREVVGTRKVSASDLGQSSGWNALDTSSGNYNYTAPATEAAEQWEGWGTALKPAFEPVVVGRKPLEGTVAQNVQRYGTGALNIDATRIGETVETWPKSRNYSAKEMSRPGSTLATDAETQLTGPAPAGRWPANVVLDETTAPLLDQQSGRAGAHGSNRGTGLMRGDIGPVGLKERSATTPPNDEGGASRFFYVAKAPKRERPVVDGVAHPTVKPLALMRWLVKLVTPPGGTVLEPFAGSGATVEACMLEGFNVIAIEQEADYIPLIQARIDRAA
jgi:site-specific DNA-methyltransferase (adenine-specific)